jgi:hypothetical protein
MPTKPKQQKIDNQNQNRKVVIDSFREWCQLSRKAPNEAAATEFTADMEGLYGGTSIAELKAFIRSDPLFQS